MPLVADEDGVAAGEDLLAVRAPAGDYAFAFAEPGLTGGHDREAKGHGGAEEQGAEREERQRMIAEGKDGEQAGEGKQERGIAKLARCPGGIDGSSLGFDIFWQK